MNLFISLHRLAGHRLYPMKIIFCPDRSVIIRLYTICKVPQYPSVWYSVFELSNDTNDVFLYRLYTLSKISFQWVNENHRLDSYCTSSIGNNSLSTISGWKSGIWKKCSVVLCLITILVTSTSNSSRSLDSLEQIVPRI